LTQNQGALDKDIGVKLPQIILLEKYLDENFPQQYSFVYSGGGNSIIRFENSNEAVRFIKGYYFKVLYAYPDLELYISLVDEEKDDIECQNYGKDKQIRELLIERSDELKDKRRAQFKRWTYGIERIGENGKAKEIMPDKQNENMEELARKLVRRYLFKKFENALKDAVTITAELQKYKKWEDGKSYIGVISIDGNKMGDMVNKINRFEDLKNFSETIDKVYFEAIVEALKEYRGKAEAQALLVTPILQAGDDICLIVEAEHAIEIAADIIRKIEEISQRDHNKKVLEQFMESNYLTACGGVTIVRYTYPFFEAVKIAEGLCHKAKEIVHSVKSATKERQRNSFLHWEVVQSQVTTGIEYENYVKNRDIQEKYHIKPLCIDQDALVEDNIFSYDAFNRMIRGIQEEKDISSSLLEELKKQMYGGIEQYRLFLEINKKDSKILKSLVINILENHVDSHMTLVEENGNQTTCTYVLSDVLEALPFTAKIRGDSNGTGKDLQN
jgi:hypothetical protein